MKPLAEKTASSAAMNATSAVLGLPLSMGLADYPALVFEDQTISFAELDILSARFAEALKRRNLDKGDRVLLLMRDCPELIAAYLGVMRAGLVAIAYNTRASESELAYVLKDTGAPLVFIDGSLKDLFGGATEKAGFAPEAIFCTPGELEDELGELGVFLDGTDGASTPEPMDLDDIAYWIYTSGTTGHPKGAMHRHKALLVGDRHVRENLGVRPGDKMFSTSRMFFAYALGHLLMGGLRAGATLVLHADWPDPVTVADVIERHEPDFVFSVPAFYRALLRDGFAAKPAFLSVRQWMSAGEKLPQSLFDRWKEATGKSIIEGIGASEATFLFIANSHRDAHCGSCGRLLDWAEARLMDEAGNRITEPDVNGVLWVKMQSNAVGYWNKPEQTDESFKDGWYCTGDVFSFDENGWWRHHGRSDDRLKISGQWVSPTEIEEKVLAFKDISEAAVVGALVEQLTLNQRVQGSSPCAPMSL